MFIPEEKHIKILDIIGRNKAISLKDLHEETKEDESYKSLSRTTIHLEKLDLVGSARGGQRKKYFFLKDKGAFYTEFSAPHGEDMANLGHDITASKILRDLLTFENFKSGYIVAESGRKSLIPDGVINAIRNGRKYTLALEIELTAKSKRRVTNKFILYSNSSEYDHVLYVLGSKRIYDTYKEVILGLSKEVQGKIILSLFPEKLAKKYLDYTSAKCWLRNRERGFSEVFKDTSPDK